jgi:hypothetical protein
MTGRQILAASAVVALAVAVGFGFIKASGYKTCSTAKCDVVVTATVTGDICTVTKVEPEKLKVTMKNAKIIWKFDASTPDFQFCKSGNPFEIGDGAILKSPDPYTQFFDRCRDDKDDCDTLQQLDCSSKYQMRFKGSVGNEYGYDIVFRGKSNKNAVCVYDPFIKN